VPGYIAQLYAVPGWSSLPWLHRIPHPTLVLAGDDDPIVPLVNDRILADRIPHARLHAVKGGGHLFLLDDSEQIATVVADFWRKEKGSAIPTGNRPARRIGPSP
jgi:poly(3-hydroxyoctanoate) depolymerase